MGILLAVIFIIIFLAIVLSIALGIIFYVIIPVTFVSVYIGLLHNEKSLKENLVLYSVSTVIIIGVLVGYFALISGNVSFNSEKGYEKPLELDKKIHIPRLQVQIDDRKKTVRTKFGKPTKENKKKKTSDDYYDRDDGEYWIKYLSKDYSGSVYFITIKPKKGFLNIKNYPVTIDDLVDVWGDQFAQIPVGKDKSYSDTLSNLSKEYKEAAVIWKFTSKSNSYTRIAGKVLCTFHERKDFIGNLFNLKKCHVKSIDIWSQ